MRVRVLLFGPLAEIYGVREEWLEVGCASRAADVYKHYRERDPRIGELHKSLHIAVNQAVVAADHQLAPDDEVALLPPVCGGSDLILPPGDWIALLGAPLETQPWRRHLADEVGTFGALTSFEGLVRREGEGDPVIALAFDAYEPMAISAMRELAAEARERWKIQGIVILHRLGTVPAGEVCVVIAVAAGHRDEGFLACKFIIDTLKATVPIWKKEITALTSRWVDGTLLPEAKESPLAAR